MKSKATAKPVKDVSKSAKAAATPLKKTPAKKASRAKSTARATSAKLEFVDLQRMANAYNSDASGADPSTPTWWTHFPLKEVAQFLIDGRIPRNTSLDDLAKSTTTANGLKIYLAQHYAEIDCPGNNPDYIGTNTVAVVMTSTADGGATWRDVDVNKRAAKNVFLLPQKMAAAGKGLDKTEVYPPGTSGVTHYNAIDPTVFPGTTPTPVTTLGTGKK